MRHKTTDEQIQEALDMFELMQKDDEERGYFKEIDLQMASNKVLGWFLHLAENTSKNDSKASDFKSGVNILVKLFKAYRRLLNESLNLTMKATYWRMKYESVQSQEAIQDRLSQNLMKLIEENEQLKQKLNEENRNRPT